MPVRYNWVGNQHRLPIFHNWFFFSFIIFIMRPLMSSKIIEIPAHKNCNFVKTYYFWHLFWYINCWGLPSLVWRFKSKTLSTSSVSLRLQDIFCVLVCGNYSDSIETTYQIKRNLKPIVCYFAELHKACWLFFMSDSAYF